jgi:uncharacterized membrane protein YedE/YeeE
MDWLSMGRWSPYLVGIGIGLLSWVAFLLSDRPLGCSTAFSKTCGLIERTFRGDKVVLQPYYQKVTPTVDWQWVIAVGILLGAFVSAQLSGQFKWQWVPTLWASTFGPAPVPRLIVAFVGGILLGLGSRWADGCTSGHGISGTMQLTVSSWVASICFFIGGIAAAMAIYAIWA